MHKTFSFCSILFFSQQIEINKSNINNMISIHCALEKIYGQYATSHCSRSTGLYNLPRASISPKACIIVSIKFEFAYFEAAVQHFKHYTVGTPLVSKGLSTIITIFSKLNYIFFNLSKIICLYTELHIFLSNTNNFQTDLWFNGISTILGYSILNPLYIYIYIYIYILNIWFGLVWFEHSGIR